MTKKKKIILIASLSLLSAVVTYFGGGLIVTKVAFDGFINKRFSDVSTLLTDDFYRIQKVRTDYPSLDERKEIPFYCNGETLKGYLYEVNSPKGLIIMAHGVNNQADGNSAQMQDYFVTHGYDLFAIDMTGCGRSTGPGIKNLHESRYCVKNAVNYVKGLNEVKDLPIFLIGHSWGGYGVVAATNDVDGISAVCSMSGYNLPNEMTYGFVEGYTSPVVGVMQPSLNFSLSVLYGNDSFFPAEKAIKRNSDLPFMVIHGSNDHTVPLKRYSLYTNIIKDNYLNVTPVLLEGMSHGAPWKTLDAVSYMASVEKDLKALSKQYGGKIPDDVHEAYLTTVDKEKSSVVNTQLLDSIDQFFQSNI